MDTGSFYLFGIWGFGILLYIILMILVPEPITSADRLAMKGKPINIQNIAHKVEEEIDDLTDRFDEWRDKWRRKKKKENQDFNSILSLDPNLTYHRKGVIA